MASRIQGITIEIDGNTTGLQKALKGVDSSLKQTQSTLRDVDKLLKLDPTSTELLTQKQKALKDAIKLTGDRLEELKKAQDGVAEGTPEWDALQREIIATEQNLKGLKKEYRDFGSVSAQQLKAAGNAMQGFGEKVSAAGQALMPLSTAAAGALTAMGGVALKSVQAADDLLTLAQQTGFTTDEIQKMQYASELVDVSFEDMTGALTKVKKGMSGTGEAFEAIGVSVRNADGSMRDATSVFYDSLDALSKIDNETERDAAAMAIFGKGADQLAGIIDDGGKSLKAYGKEAEDLGVIMGGDVLEDLGAVDDTLQKLKSQGGAALAKLGATLAKTLAPVLAKIPPVIEKISKAIGKLTPKQTETILKITGIVAAIGPLLLGVGKVIKIGGTLVTAIGSIVGVLGGPLTAAIAAVIAAGVLIWKNWDTIKQKATQLKDWLKQTWENIKTSVSSAAESLKTKVSATWNGIKSATSTAWDAVKTTLSQKWANIKSAYQEHGGGLKGIASATVTGIKEYWTLGFDTLNNVLGGKLDVIKTTLSGAWNNIKSTAAGVWDNIKNSITTAITSAKDTVSSMIDKIKGFFSFEWKLPKLKLPHVKLTKGEWPWGLMGKGVAPSVSIEWYKKAYQNPMMFTTPTVLATPNGYKGFGDGHGAEIVLGLNKLRELVGSVGDVTINVYTTPGQNAKEIAYEVQRVLVAQQQQRSRAYA